MKERPILFSAPMVRAVLEGRKTQTRRVIKPQPVEPVMPATSFGHHGLEVAFGPNNLMRNGGLRWWRCPYGQTGDRLWVRETFRYDDYAPNEMIYQADCPAQAVKETKGIIRWKPSIHMPRQVSRITMEIAGIRVERVQEISEANAISEGTERVGNLYKCYGECQDHESGHDKRSSAIASYMSLWDFINSKKPGCSWDDNPWVWVIEFWTC